jgi:DNA polymerase-3 subunit beta
MKITVERDKLLGALTHIQGLVERRNTVPILSNILLDVQGNELRIFATDMVIEVIQSLNCSVVNAGKTTISAHTIYDIIRKLPAGSQIEIVQGDTKDPIEIKSGKSNFKLPSISPEEFPMMDSEKMPFNFLIKSKDLSLLLDRTKFAMSAEETRHYLNGIYFHKDKGSLIAVATDGHRLAKFELNNLEQTGDIPSIILPRKAVLEIRKLLEDYDKQVSISLDENKICFSLDTLKFSSKLVDGHFPDYSKVIPEGNKNILIINRESFSSIVDRISTVSTEQSQAIKFSLEKKILAVSASSPDSGSAVEQLAVDYDSEPITISFNAKYLLDITGNIREENIRLELATPSSPTLIRGEKDNSSVYVIMPMRI